MGMAAGNPKTRATLATGIRAKDEVLVSYITNLIVCTGVWKD